MSDWTKRAIQSCNLRSWCALRILILSRKIESRVVGTCKSRDIAALNHWKMAENVRNARRRNRIIANAEDRLSRLKNTKHTQGNDISSNLCQQPASNVTDYESSSLTPHRTSWNCATVPETLEEVHSYDLERKRLEQPSDRTFEEIDMLTSPGMTQPKLTVSTNGGTEVETIRVHRSDGESVKNNQEVASNIKFFSVLDLLFVFCYVALIRLNSFPFAMIPILGYAAVGTVLRDRHDISFQVVFYSVVQIIQCVCCVLFLSVISHVIVQFL